MMQSSDSDSMTRNSSFDHPLEDDLQQTAVIEPSFVYNAAMGDQKMPRKPLGSRRQTSPPHRSSSCCTVAVINAARSVCLKRDRSAPC